jgi:hypothetical protein
MAETIRTDVTGDGTLLRRAARPAGTAEAGTPVRVGLEALIARRSVHRLVRAGGTRPRLTSIRRRRSGAS